MRMKNETIKKLTNEEMNNLGCFNIGIVPVRGIPKARVKGLRTTLRTDDEMWYESDVIRTELIKLTDESGDCWVVRRYRMVDETYEDFVQPLIAIQFVK